MTDKFIMSFYLHLYVNILNILPGGFLWVYYLKITVIQNLSPRTVPNLDFQLKKLYNNYAECNQSQH